MTRLPPPQQARWQTGTVFTVGHSTLPVGQFIAMLQAYGIECLADIRTVPRSRHNPQFNSDALATSLQAASIDYVPMPALGGLRHARKDSPNAGWRNRSFRGYADYMQTTDFRQALEALIAASQRQRVAIMCAEAVPWRCHRSLIADALFARGIEVMHIMGAGPASPHRPTSFAHIEGSKVTYPGADA